MLGVVGLVLGLAHAICNESANVYPNTAKGWFILLVDHTWSLVNTIVGSGYLMVLLAIAASVAMMLGVIGIY